MSKQLTDNGSMLQQLQKQSEELMQKNFALEKYALLINNAADISCIIDANTLFIEEINNASTHLLGFSPEHLKGTCLVDYFVEEDRAQVQQLKDTSGDRFSFEACLYDSEKESRCFSWNIVHKHGLWFANGRDITGQKKAEQAIQQLNKDLRRNIAQLELTNKELESFSYSVSHDLRAPLRSINGFSQILEEEYAEELGDEPVRLLGVIRNNAKKMGNLIDDLLSFARMGRKEVTRRPVDFNKLVDPIVEDLVNGAKKEVKVTVHTLQAVPCDPVLVSQVFYNLIGNAFKYSSKVDNPQVEIGSYEKDDEIVYFIKDNGAGFDMNYAHKLFGVFQRLHTPSEFEGTGVGLAIVQRIIVRHGGTVWAEGKENVGATFYFSLPRS